jgi:hypothetical protein
MKHDMTSSAKVDIEVDSQADSWFAKLGPGLITGAADDDPRFCCSKAVRYDVRNDTND